MSDDRLTPLELSELQRLDSVATASRNAVTAFTDYRDAIATELQGYRDRLAAVYALRPGDTIDETTGEIRRA